MRDSDTTAVPATGMGGSPEKGFPCPLSGVAAMLPVALKVHSAFGDHGGESAGSWGSSPPWGRVGLTPYCLTAGGAAVHAVASPTCGDRLPGAGGVGQLKGVGRGPEEERALGFSQPGGRGSGWPD